MLLDARSLYVVACCCCCCVLSVIGCCCVLLCVVVCCLLAFVVWLPDDCSYLLCGVFRSLVDGRCLLLVDVSC